MKLFIFVVKRKTIIVRAKNIKEAAEIASSESCNFTASYYERLGKELDVNGDSKIIYENYSD